jgi:cytochrome c-type biogenesis protein CcmH
MCPTCETTLELSNAPAANQIRRFVCARAAAGDSKSEIKDKLVADFGPGVLASPPKKGFDLLAWVLPLLALGAGAAVLAGLVVRWSRRDKSEAGSEPPSANGRADLDPALEKRVDEELARFE